MGTSNSAFVHIFGFLFTVLAIILKLPTFLFLKKIFYLFGYARSQLWLMESSSLTRDQTHAPSIRSKES